MKSDALFKRTYNEVVDHLIEIGRGEAVPSEVKLSQHFGVSRTTIRKVLEALAQRGAVAGQGRQRYVGSIRRNLPRYARKEVIPTAAQVESKFMEWMLRDNAIPGTAINELELARKFGFATTAIREFLNRFQRFGLIEKRQRSGWILKGFTPSFALELFEIREMFELRSARAFAQLPRDAEQWKMLAALREEHTRLLDEAETRFFDFSDLDRRFHLLVNSAASNRFIDGFYDVITLVFHYHYQWNKQEERKRNERAMREHLAYIDALNSGSLAEVEQACRIHLHSAKTTMLLATTN
jgi:DNA-binding GntR family transcriptional regulator